MTIKEQQLLLAYLAIRDGDNALSPGAIDGLDGKRTQAALGRLKSVYGVGADGLVGVVAGTAAPVRKADSVSFWDEIRYFRRQEFACRCGKCGGFPAEPAEKLVRMAEKVRGHFGKAASISSGVRCAAHNAAVGGVSNSRHLKGWACDISVQGVSPASLDAYIGSLPECAYHYRITKNGKDTGYVHMDVVL